MHLPDNTLLHGGTYRIIRFINSGGFGCTYEAEHVMLKKRVAIKEFFVKDFCNRDEQTAYVTVATQSKKGLVDKLSRKFVEEAQALAKLHHPGIVNVSDIFEENGTAYYVMDYIEGKSLSELIREKGPMPEVKALGYIREVSEALEYIHNNNRLHLDIKPSNIMVDTHDHAILIDFGTSKQYDEENGENTSTLLGKTPGYASIEQMGNSVSKFTPATDIYSLGATLYKMLSNITPLDANLLASGESQLPLPDSVSETTVAAVTAAMQLNKNLRPQRVSDFMILLTKVKDEEEVTVLDITTEKKSLKYIFFLKKKSRLWVGSVIIFFIVCSLLFFNWDKKNEVDEVSISGTINGHNYVDLGLSVKWATCNMGADFPEDYGDYYAWGEIEKKHEFIEKNSKTYGFHLGNIAGSPCYDVASALWKKGWRLPTQEEIKELIANCTTTWITYKGKKGCLVTSKKTGNTLFFPAAGYQHNDSVNGSGDIGLFWSASPYLGYTGSACSLRFDSDYFDWSWFLRYDGHSIRPVCEY